MNIQERLTAFAMLGAEWVMWLLVLLSIISIAIILERAYYFLTSRGAIASLHEGLLKHLRAGERDKALSLLSASSAPEARIAHACLSGADEGPAAAEERMASESLLARLQMERNLAFLGTVGNNAPFIGLLGTVIGVIQAFQQLDTSNGQVSAGLMDTIGEALVATAIGILVALPAVAFFNLYSRLVKGRLTRADAIGRDVLAVLKSKLPGASTAEEH